MQVSTAPNACRWGVGVGEGGKDTWRIYGWHGKGARAREGRTFFTSGVNSSIGSAGQGAPHLIFSSQLPGQWGSSGLPQSRSSQQACGGRPKMDHDRSRVGSFGFSDSVEKGYVTLEGNGAAGAVGDGRIMRVGPAAPPAVNAHALAFRSGVAPLERGATSRLTWPLLAKRKMRERRRTAFIQEDTRPRNGAVHNEIVHTHTHRSFLGLQIVAQDHPPQTAVSPTTASGRSMPRTLKSAQTKRPREERKRKQLREKTL